MSDMWHCRCGEDNACMYCFNCGGLRPGYEPFPEFVFSIPDDEVHFTLTDEIADRRRRARLRKEWETNLHDSLLPVKQAYVPTPQEPQKVRLCLTSVAGVVQIHVFEDPDPSSPVKIVCDGGDLFGPVFNRVTGKECILKGRRGYFESLLRLTQQTQHNSAFIK